MLSPIFYSEISLWLHVFTAITEIKNRTPCRSSRFGSAGSRDFWKQKMSWIFLQSRLSENIPLSNQKKNIISPIRNCINNCKFLNFAGYYKISLVLQAWVNDVLTFDRSIRIYEIAIASAL